MKHDFNIVFETENELWNKVLEIWNSNEKFPKKKVSNRHLHHKFPRSFSKKLKEDVDNDKDNLVSLTPGDHFMIHFLYWKLARKGYRASMALAFNLMYRKYVSKISLETVKFIKNDIDELENDIKEGFKEYYNEHPEKCEQRSKTRTGMPHPHKGGFQSVEKRNKIALYRTGRKEPPRSEFGQKFREYYKLGSRDDIKLYNREFYYYKRHGKCSWEQ